MIEIMIADDHAVVRAGLKQCVSDTKGIIVKDEACNGDEAFEKALKNDYDVILLDITMPGRNVLDIIKEIKALKPQVKILILTIHPEEQYAMRGFQAGALGYLTKESAPQELISAIRKVASGGRYISLSLAEKLVFKIGAKKEDHNIHQTLSNREYQVMCMTVSGAKLNDIAEELSINIKTVSSYRSRILQKLNLTNTIELIRYAIDNQLVS
jgi:two-component system invasion response regulator UvrY